MQCIIFHTRNPRLIPHPVGIVGILLRLPAILTVAPLALDSLDDMTLIGIFLYALYHPKKPGQRPYQVAVAGILQETTSYSDSWSTCLGFSG
jgi:hypothetical protein